MATSASRVLANVYRQDLENAGLGNGRHGFLLKLEGLAPSARPCRARHAGGRWRRGAGFAGHSCPATLQFDDEMQQHLVAMLGDAETDEELTRRAAFLAQQADRLLQMRADRRANRPDRVGHRQFRARWSGRGAAAAAGAARRAPW